MAPPPAEPTEGLCTCAAAKKWNPTHASALRGAAQERRCDSTAPELKSHTVTPASTPEHTTTTSLTVASLLHPPTAPPGRPQPSWATLSHSTTSLSHTNASILHSLSILPQRPFCLLNTKSPPLTLLLPVIFCSKFKILHHESSTSSPQALVQIPGPTPFLFVF